MPEGQPKNSSKQKKESPPLSQKKEGTGRPTVTAVRARAASSDEAAAVERAVDGLLVAIVRQVRGPY